ncbi:MAG: ATP synthase F1 subunit delta [Thermoguttaceae bacterium]|nr:ATP synthase F1 subunit delta [Thermoguttaceae bacterium]MDW8079688.1 ATP synthase F1 subunit delta [Thermoguttaceae bacterium]
MATDYSSSHARFAAAFWAQIQAEPVARAYAKALFGAAQNAGLVDKVLEQFDSLLQEVFKEFPQFELLLASAFIPFAEKEAVLDRVLGPQAVPIFLNFLKVVVRRARVPLLREIYREFRLLVDEAAGRVAAEVTTAFPLDAQEQALVVQAVREMVGKEPILTYRVDPQLIGGIVVRIGDKVYDASVAGQLRSLAQQIVDRAVHEIQSRRDRFRSSAGN